MKSNGKLQNTESRNAKGKVIFCGLGQTLNWLCLCLLLTFMILLNVLF